MGKAVAADTGIVTPVPPVGKALATGTGVRPSLQSELKIRSQLASFVSPQFLEMGLEVPGKADPGRPWSHWSLFSWSLWSECPRGIYMLWGICVHSEHGATTD